MEHSFLKYLTFPISEHFGTLSRHFTYGNNKMLHWASAKKKNKIKRKQFRLSRFKCYSMKDNELLLLLET